MRPLLISILAIFLSISAYSQTAYTKKRIAGGKMNTVRAVKSGRSDKHVPTEGDGTGDKIVGQMPRKVRNLYNNFIKKRQNFAKRRYRLKSEGGEPIKPSVKR